MTFIWPYMLVSLVLVPVLVIVYLNILRGRTARQRNAFAAQFRGLGASQIAAARQPGARRHIPPALFLVGVTLLLVALARPQTTVSLPRVEGTVILAFDVSGSMAADDLKPTRMDAAKAAAADFVRRQPATVQVGVVGFSDSGFMVQAPSNNQDEVLAAIDRLAPQRGTSVGHGIDASLNAIAQSLAPRRTEGQAVPGEPGSLSLNTPAPTLAPTPVPRGVYTSAVIILLTDGDNNEAPDPLQSAQAAIDRGVRIYTVGIGTTQGTTVHVNGFSVHTALDEGLLQQIAQSTDGVYYNATSAQELRSIYDNLNPQLIVKPQQMEVTALFSGASILVMLAGGILSLVWFNRLP